MVYVHIQMKSAGYSSPDIIHYSMVLVLMMLVLMMLVLVMLVKCIKMTARLFGKAIDLYQPLLANAIAPSNDG